jgi:hypothetical protein
MFAVWGGLCVVKRQYAAAGVARRRDAKRSGVE